MKKLSLFFLMAALCASAPSWAAEDNWSVVAVDGDMQSDFKKKFSRQGDNALFQAKLAYKRKDLEETISLCEEAIFWYEDASYHSKSKKFDVFILEINKFVNKLVEKLYSPKHLPVPASALENENEGYKALEEEDYYKAKKLFLEAKNLYWQDKNYYDAKRMRKTIEKIEITG